MGKLEEHRIDPVDKNYDLSYIGHTEQVRNVTVGEIVIAQLKELTEEYFAEMESSHPDEAPMSVKYRKQKILPQAKFELNKFQTWIEKRLSRDYNSN